MICWKCGKRRLKGNSCPHCKAVDLDRLRSINVQPSATPSRKNSIAPRRPNNSFEKGRRTDSRGLSYLNSDGQPLKMKESFDRSKYWEDRTSITVSNGGNS